MASIIKVENLGMTYTSKLRRGLFKSEKISIEALKGINLEIEENTIFGLLGPNGAGKTSLIKCLTTLLIPTKGTAITNGHDIRTEEKMVRASIGAMLMGERGLYWKLTTRENLEYFGRLYSLKKDFIKKRIDYVLNLMEIEDISDRPIESYSSGQKMRAAFAKSLLHDPPILFLDEPTIAMDVQGARKLKSIVKKLPETNKTIIYTTHIMQEAHDLCDRVAIIDQGRIIAEDTPKNLIEKSSINFSIDFLGQFEDYHVELVNKLDVVKKSAIVTRNGELGLEVIVNNNRDALPKISKVLIENEASISQIVQREPTLEDVFIQMTGRSLSQDTEE